MTHEERLEKVFARVGGIFKLQGFTFKAMRRQLNEQGKGVIDLNKTHTLAYTNLKKKEVTIDIYTTKHRKPKAMASILRILAHEIAHHQKLPFRQFYRGKWIVRQHYPEFYKQVNTNVEMMKRDEYLGKFFVEKENKMVRKKKTKQVKKKTWIDKLRNLV